VQVRILHQLKTKPASAVTMHGIMHKTLIQASYLLGIGVIKSNGEDYIMAGFGRIGRALSAAERADRNASREGVRPGSGKSGNRGDTPEFAERDRRAAAERAERRRNEEGARTTQRTSSITGAPVSMRDIQAATDQRTVDALSRRIDEMPDNALSRRLMSAIRDRQQAIIDRQNELDMQRATARAGTSAGARRSTNKPENITLPSMREDAPDRAFSKGGMAKKYNKGGYANCGASMKPDGKRRK
jgi:hypothetical protein